MSVIEELQKGLFAAIAAECPEGGTACLHLEHFSSNTFFPIAWHPELPKEVTDSYYLRPFVFEPPGERCVDLDTCDMETLSDGFRFEIACGLSGKVEQKAEILDYSGRQGSARLLLVRTSPRRAVDHRPWDERHLQLLEIIHKAWARAHTDTPRIEGEQLNTLGEELVKLLADIQKTPPYFPLHRFRVAIGLPGKDPQFEKFSQNFLSLNSLLRKVSPQRDAPWIFDTPAKFVGHPHGQWTEDVATHRDFDTVASSELRFLAGLTIDVVRVFGRYQAQGRDWLLCARHNKPREPARETVGVAQSVCVPLKSARGAIRAMFEYKREPDDALVTFWAVGSKIDDPSDIRALQLGAWNGDKLLNPGKNEAGDDYTIKRTSAKGLVTLKAVPLHLHPALSEGSSDLDAAVRIAGEKAEALLRVQEWDFKRLDIAEDLEESLKRGWGHNSLAQSEVKSVQWLPQDPVEFDHALRAAYFVSWRNLPMTVSTVHSFMRKMVTDEVDFAELEPRIASAIIDLPTRPGIFFLFALVELLRALGKKDIGLATPEVSWEKAGKHIRLRIRIGTAGIALLRATLASNDIDKEPGSATYELRRLLAAQWDMLKYEVSLKTNLGDFKGPEDETLRMRLMKGECYSHHHPRPCLLELKEGTDLIVLRLAKAQLEPVSR